MKYGKHAFVAHLDAAEVLQPGVGAFDFPALAVSVQLAFVLEATVADVLSVGNNQLRSPAVSAASAGDRSHSPIGDDAPQVGARASASRPRHLHLPERAFREPAFGNLRRRKLHSDRYAPAVDRHHALRTFPATCFADCRAPLFRGDEHRVEKGLFPIQQPALVQHGKQFPPSRLPDALFFPYPQPPPAGGTIRVLVGQIAPSGSGSQHLKNPFRARTVRGPGATTPVLASLRLRKQRTQYLPLRFAQTHLPILLLHGRRSTNYPPHP